MGSAFGRFAGAWLESKGKKSHLSEKARTQMIHLRWSTTLRYLRAKHRLFRVVGHDAPPELQDWMDGPMPFACHGDYDRFCEITVGTVLSAAGKGHTKPRFVFMYNPDDPFIDINDVKWVIELTEEAGFDVVESPVSYEHVQAL